MKTVKFFIGTFVIVFIIAAITFIGLAAPKKRAKLDGDTVWKQQCSRCHLTPGAIPKSKMETVLRHMRDAAPLTKEEYKAVLEFIRK